MACLALVGHAILIKIHMFVMKSYHLLLSIFFFCMLISCQESQTFDKQDQEPIVKIPERITGYDNILAYSVDADPSKRVVFKKDLVLEETDNAYLGDIHVFAVDSSGFFYIADKKVIKIFDAEGNFEAELGREGKGPGEFSNFGPLIPKVLGNKLYVYEDVQQKVNVFDLDKRVFLLSISMASKDFSRLPENEQLSYDNFFPVNDSLLLVGFKNIYPGNTASKNKTKYYLINHRSRISSEEVLALQHTGLYNGIGVPGPIRIAPNIPFTNASTRHSILRYRRKRGDFYSLE
ncbi:MAG: 6-bladed beta-propeller [Balneolaceae bacterium]|nr:6-bladed beta-propeller [Balneolaceae bacterium]